jgi:hypothetical protein
MTLREILADIHALEQDMLAFERKSVDHDLLPLDCQIQRKVADLAIHHERFVIY